MEPNEAHQVSDRLRFPGTLPSPATRLLRLVECDRILEITSARKARAQRSQIMPIPFIPTRRHARSLYRRHRPGRDGIPRLHHQPVFAGIVLKSTKDDQTVCGRLDLVAEELEAVTKTETCDLALDQALRGLRQRPLRLADANRERAAFGLAGFDEELAEEMRFIRVRR